MIYPATFYSAKCDNCCLDWLHDDNEFAAMIEENQMIDVIEEDNWHVDGEKTFCCDCWSHDDNDEIVIDKTRKDLHNKDKPIEVRACDTDEFYINAANSDAKCNGIIITEKFFETRICDGCTLCIYNKDKVIVKPS